jgi:hypothetical protein
MFNIEKLNKNIGGANSLLHIVFGIALLDMRQQALS